VPEDSSLTEFVGGDGQSESENEGDADQPARDETSPATVTYAWDDAGRECAACGETVTKRWTGEEGMVCGACKSW
jgi:hypothetical protein